MTKEKIDAWKEKEEIIEEKVGYKQPPKETPVQKGKSGNPKGRSKGSKNLKTILKKELEGKITIPLKNDKYASQILVRLITGIMSDQERPHYDQFGDYRVGTGIITKICKFLEELEKETAAFPYGKNDDQLELWLRCSTI